MAKRANLVVVLAVSIIVLTFLTSTAVAEEPYDLAWIRQLGTSAGEASYAVATDTAGNVLITGYTTGDFEGTNAGEADAFVSKYDISGNLLWVRQLGTSSSDGSFAVAADDTGNIFITGYTWGSLGGPNIGKDDAFLSKYDALGNLLWTRQLGSSDWDISYGVTVDKIGNVFICGYTWGNFGGANAGKADAFVSKYDTSGNLLWSRQFGASGGDYASAVATDAAGNVFISGRLSVSRLNDAFVNKYDTSGNLLWTRQLGTSGDEDCKGVATDTAGNVYICGLTAGSLGGPIAGNVDAFVSKYDPSGNLLWTHQHGTPEWDGNVGVSVDPTDNIFVSGYTSGSLGGPNAGERDVYVSKYDSDGNILWTNQLGTPEGDYSSGVATDAYGSVLVSGWTGGSLDGSNAGSGDAFVVKYGEVEPEEPIVLLSLEIVGPNEIADDSQTQYQAIAYYDNNSTEDITNLAVWSVEPNDIVNIDGGLLTAELIDVSEDITITAGYIEGEVVKEARKDVSVIGISADAMKPYRLGWKRQWGKSINDWIGGVTSDANGNIITSGSVWVEPKGTSEETYLDIFVRKYNTSGHFLWAHQFGSNSWDVCYGVAVDKVGNTFITGYTEGDLSGPSIGKDDAFISKYDISGNLLWTRQLGTPEDDSSKGIAVDETGNIFITGATRGNLDGINKGNGDAFISKYDTSGNLLWVRQLGTSGTDFCSSIAIDKTGNILISGITSGSLDRPNAGGIDAFVCKYDTFGNILWIRQLGTSERDYSNSVAADNMGNVFIAGTTQGGGLGGPNAGGYDIFICKYDASGNLLWTQQLGTSGTDNGFGVATDSIGNIFVTGGTFGSLNGQPRVGGYDAYLCKLDTFGRLLWTRQFGTSEGDFSASVTVDRAGNVFVAGETWGRFGGGNAGYDDVFLARFKTTLPTVESLEISGPNEVVEDYQVQYQAIAHYYNSTTEDVTALAEWSVEPNDIASIDSGLLTVELLNLSEDVTITAKYGKESIITITAITFEDAIEETLDETVDKISNLDPNTLKNSNMTNALTNKIDEVLAMIDAGLYEDALAKLKKDILKKTDGCANNGKPDKNDWIKTCEEQGLIYPLVVKTIEYVESLME